METNFEKYLKAVGYKISEGSEFLWFCYGENARYLDCDTDDYHVSAVFDTETLEVYEVSISSLYSGTIAYKWHNSEFINQYQDEAEKHNCPWDQCSEDLNWSITDDFDDIIEKIQKMLSNEEFDPRVVVWIELDKDVYDGLNEMSERDGISIDELIEKLFMKLIEESEK